ncbi:cytochrome d ubiquinol oxidase subunit II [Antribacter gilvus]|uniref:cytochrome d ubiquinol oxidase subunit II n=1 Tax=Antribacter gilvus TaxID=2304675 RepID=UPI0013DF5252|nr:cytochrome d ubiquinol oxidase subunit II [Antribacter gilvus]
MTAAVWGVLLTVLLAGWALLDGAVQGTGAALGSAPTGAERRVRLAAVGPLLLAGEVWLVAAAGVLVGAFPHAESALAAAGYPVLVALVASWAARDAGLWLRSRRASAVWRSAWDRVIVVASTVLSAAFGALLGVVWGSVWAAAGLAVTFVLLVRLHGAAVVARRLGTTARAPLWLTSVAVLSPVLVTVVAAWPALMHGAVSVSALAALGGIVLAALPALVVVQVAAWWLVARPLGRRDVVFF